MNNSILYDLRQSTIKIRIRYDNGGRATYVYAIRNTEAPDPNGPPPPDLAVEVVEEDDGTLEVRLPQAHVTISPGDRLQVTSQLAPGRPYRTDKWVHKNGRWVWPED